MPTTHSMITGAPQAPSRPTGCLHCGATVGSGMSWCSLCFGPVGGGGCQPPAPTPAPAPAPSGDGPVDEGPEDDLGSDVVGSDHDVDVDVDVDALADDMLAQLAAADDDPLRARAPRSTQAKTALMAGGAVGGCLLLMLVLWVLGLFL